MVLSDELHNPSAANLHSPFGTELLTAEASNAGLAVDGCLFVSDGDGLGRTQIGANPAADTGSFRHGLGA